MTQTQLTRKELNIVFKNTLILEKISKSNKFEKQLMVKELLTSRTERELSVQIGVPQTTINDWKNARMYDNENKGVSLNLIYSRIKQINPTEIKDWGRLEQIKEEIERLLRFKKVVK